MLYNANVNRAPAHRRTLDQLRHDLRKAEEAEQKTRKETVDDPVAYQVRPPPFPSCLIIRLTMGMCTCVVQKANKAVFAKLTEAARPKKKAASTQGTATPSQTPGDDADADDGAVPAPIVGNIIEVDEDS